MTSRTPLGTAMKRTPTTAKVSASRRRLKTTNLSAPGPCIAPRTILAKQPAMPPRYGVVVFRNACRYERQPRCGAPRIRRVIDRDQVLHVARLARLRLSEGEVETM